MPVDPHASGSEPGRSSRQSGRDRTGADRPMSQVGLSKGAGALRRLELRRSDPTPQPVDQHLGQTNRPDKGASVGPTAEGTGSSRITARS